MGKIKPKKINVKALDKLWKPVSIEANLVEADFEGLIGFEEITDYKVTKGHEGSKNIVDISKENRKKNKKIEELEANTVKKQKPGKKAAVVAQDVSQSETTKGKKSGLIKAQNKNKRDKVKKAAKKLKNKGIRECEEEENDNASCEENADEISETTNEKPHSGMEAWSGMGISDLLLKALKSKGFTAPTQVQALTIPPAILGRRDILGAAETGSGKTLAFGLPILQGILIQKAKAAQKTEEANNSEDNGSESGDEKNADSKNQDQESSDSDDIENDGDDEEVDMDKDDDDEEIGEGEDDDVDDEEVDVGEDEDDENDDFNGDLVEDDIEDDDENDFSGDLVEDDSEDDVEDDDNEAGGDSDDSEDDKKKTLDKSVASEMGCVRVVDNAVFKLNDKGPKSNKFKQKPLYALILTPTRELAVQIRNHLLDAAKFTDIKVALVVGGLSSQKQERLLNYGPEIVVGTPGRLWELIQQRHPHLSHIETIRFLAIDETDRMLEKSHFEELAQLLTVLKDRKPDDIRRQNFLFSATLSLVHAPPSYIKRLKKNKKKAQLTPETKLQNIVKEMGLENPKVVDITQPNCVPKTLKEARIICTTEDKDFYLYYFLKLHPGRTLVFCNSIGCVQRLHSLFTLLGCSPHPLHSNMQQRQRLKNLERFTQNPKAVLVATDVAARGLDVPNVQHVIHYQVPRTAESYVHRSGRTARASEDGLTVLLMDGSEVRTYTKIFNTLSRDPILPDFPIEGKCLIKVKERVKVARDVDKLELQAKRLSAEESWVKKAVTEMDLELSDDEMPIRSSQGEVDVVKKKAAALRKRLGILTKQPLFNPAEQLSKKAFITSGIRSDGSYVGAPAPKPSAVKALESALEERIAQRRKRKLERSKMKQTPKSQGKASAGGQSKKRAEGAQAAASGKSENADGEPVEYPDFSSKKKRRKR